MTNEFKIGILVGLALGILSLVILKNKAKNNPTHPNRMNQLDEYQKSIRTSIVLHTFIAFVVLSVLNAFIVDNWHSYTDSLNQVLIIILIVTFYYLLESVIRGAYFGINFKKKQLNLLIILAVVYSIIVFESFLKIGRGPIIQNQRLTNDFLRLCLWFWIEGIYLLIIISGYLASYRANKRCEKKQS